MIYFVFKKYHLHVWQKLNEDQTSKSDTSLLKHTKIRKGEKDEVQNHWFKNIGCKIAQLAKAR